MIVPADTITPSQAPSRRQRRRYPYTVFGDGFAARTAWLDENDGFLALDRNGDGVINDIGELFGSPEQTGFGELAELDANGDGVIDAHDAAYAQLQVWQDKNGDGVSQASELRTLEELGIASIDLDYQNVTDQTGQEGRIARQGSFTWNDGRQGVVADVLLQSSPTYTRYAGALQLDPEALAIGNIKGYGKMPDLHRHEPGRRTHPPRRLPGERCPLRVAGFLTWADKEPSGCNALFPTIRSMHFAYSMNIGFCPCLRKKNYLRRGHDLCIVRGP